MDGYFWFIAGLLIGAGLGAWEAIRQCSNAVLHGHRAWWMTAIHSAQHRVAHKKYRNDLARGYTGAIWSDEATAELERLRNKQ